MFAGVKNQMSGWLSGGIPGLSRGAGAAEGEAPPPTETEESQPQESQAPVGEQVKDDDASRWALMYLCSIYALLNRCVSNVAFVLCCRDIWNRVIFAVIKYT